MKVLILLLIASMCMISLTTDASAGLEFCNYSGDHTLWVAVAYKKGDAWVSEGWWEIHRKECKQALSHRLRNQFYYYYAHDGHGGYYGGNYNFCVSRSEPFTNQDAKSCSKNEMKGFAELDVENYTNFTFKFTGKRSGRDR